MGTKSEIQAAAYRAEQRQRRREAESHRRANIRGESTWFLKSEQPAPTPPPATNGLRTERVVLEITHSESSSAASWAWGNWTIPGESVRVVEEELSDRWAQRLARLTDERDTAIRVRDELRDSYRHCRAANTLVCDERDALRARVAELEGQLESVADRAAAAETALESAPAASGGGLTPHVWGVVRALIGAAEAVRDWAGQPLVRNEDRYCSAVDDLRVAIHAAAALLVNPQPSVPASGVPGTEVVAWAVRPVQSKEVPPGCASPRRVDRKTMTLFPMQNDAEAAAKRSGGTVIPLYAAPQPAKGWLTQEEREAVQAVILSAGKTVICKDCCRSLDQAQTILRQLEVVRSILARSTPPEVVRPGPWKIGDDPQTTQTWQPFIDDLFDKRDAEWIAALAAAGVPWKEAGK